METDPTSARARAVSVAHIAHESYLPMLFEQIVVRLDGAATWRYVYPIAPRDGYLSFDEALAAARKYSKRHKVPFEEGLRHGALVVR